MNILGIDVKPRQEIFTHLDKGSGVARTFLIETMMQFCLEYGHFDVFKGMLIPPRQPLERKVAQYLRTNQGIEQERIDRLKEPFISIPSIRLS